MNARWYIGEGDSTVIVNGETSDYPNTQIGQEITFEFYIRESGIDTREPTGATYGGTLGGT